MSATRYIGKSPKKLLEEIKLILDERKQNDYNYTYVKRLINTLIEKLNSKKSKKTEKFKKYITNIFLNKISETDNNKLYYYIFNTLYDNIDYFHNFMNIFIEIILEKENYLEILDFLIKSILIDYKDIKYIRENEYSKNSLIEIFAGFRNESTTNLNLEMDKTYKLLFLINYFIINDKKIIFDLLGINITEILNKILTDTNYTDLTDIHLIELRRKINDILFKLNHHMRFEWIGSVMSLSLLK